MVLCQVESTILETTIAMVLCQDHQVIQDQALIVGQALLQQIVGQALLQIVDQVLLQIVDQVLQIVQDQIITITQIDVKDRTIMYQETLLLYQETLETITTIVVAVLRIIIEAIAIVQEHHLHQEVVKAEVVVEDNPSLILIYFQERSQGVLFILNFDKYVSINIL